MNHWKKSDKTFTIIGGGIAGLTTAIALKKIGIHARVFEAAPKFKPVGAGITLASNALKAFKHLGLYERIREAGSSLSEFEICDEKGSAISRPNINSSEKSAMTAIHRAKLHDILLSGFEDDFLINGKRLRGFKKADSKFVLEFEDGTTHKTDYLIAADGIHSPIRNIVLPQSRLRYAGYTCWRGIVENKFNIRKATETWGAEGRVGMVPLAGTQIYWFACKKAVPDDERLKQYGPADLAQVFKDYHEPIEKLISRTPAEQFIRNDIYDLKPIHTYAFENLVLIGDAAHATTPNMGQGACQAIEDAVVLAESLKENSTVYEAFKIFEKKRLERTHYIVNQSFLIGRVAQIENRMITIIRNAVFRKMPDSVISRQLDKLYDVNFSL